MSFRVSFNVERFTTITDKAFRIMLSVILIWPQMAWAMQDESRTSGHSPTGLVQNLAIVSLQEEKPLSEESSSSLDKIEESRWRGRLRWANLDNLFQRLGYALVLRKHDITGESGCSCPVWLAGGAYPVASESARQRVLFIDGFRQGTEHVLFKTLDLFFFLSIYQIIHKLADKETVLLCQHYSESIDWWHLDINASLGFFHDILNSSSSKYILPCVPVIWGIMKGLINMRCTSISQEEQINLNDSFVSNNAGREDAVLLKKKDDLLIKQFTSFMQTLEKWSVMNSKLCDEFVRGLGDFASFQTFQDMDELTQQSMIKETLEKLQPHAQQKTSRDVGELLERFCINRRDIGTFNPFSFYKGKQEKSLINFFCEDLKLLLSSCLNFSNYLRGRLSFEQLDEEINQYGTGNSKLAGFYGNTLRWLVPYHPIDWRLNVMMKNALWNPNVSELDLQLLQNRLELLVNTQLGYTPLSALDHVKKIAFGLNARDKKAFGIKHLGERAETYSDLKRWAFELLQEREGKEDKNSTESKVCALRGQDKINKVYARYLLWSLGSKSGCGETLGFLLFKLAKLGLQFYTGVQIGRGIYEAIQCPQEAGVSMAGVEPWASGLTQECFEATSKAFGTIPGQPTDDLVGSLSKYYFSKCTIDLDLSDKDFSLETIFNITKTLYNNNVVIRKANFSNNLLTSANEFLPFLQGATILDLSSNGMSNINFSELPRSLTFLNVSNNNLEWGEGIVDFWNLPKNLSYFDMSFNKMGYNRYTSFNFSGLPESLEHLNLAWNYIGDQVEVNFVGLPSSLKYLDLSCNPIGSFYFYNSTLINISELSKINNLEYLDLSSRCGMYSFIFNNITNLTWLSSLTNLLTLKLSNSLLSYKGKIHFNKLAPTLTYLDLSNNEAMGDNETIIFSLLPSKLTYLDLSGCSIGKNGAIINFTGIPTSLRYLDLGFNEIGKGGEADFEPLLQLKSLTYLGLYYNKIGSYGSKLNLSNLPISLTSLDILGNNITVSDQHDLSRLVSLNSLFLPESGEENGVANLTGLPPLLKYLYLEGHLGEFSKTITFIGLPQNLTTLDLTDNDIGFNSSNISFIGLPSNLTSLILAENSIVNFNGLPSSLTFMDLSNAGFDSSTLNLTGLPPFLKTLILDEACNNCNDIAGLSNLTSLTYLSLMGWKVPSNFTQLPPSLEILDLSGYLYQGISNITEEMIISAKSLSSLRTLDLSIGQFGSTENIVNLSKLLQNINNLEFLNLNGNNIGSTGPEGSEAILSALLQLPNLNWGDLNIQGMTNISWTQLSQQLQNTRSQNMAEECRANKCYGAGINSDSSGGTQSSQTFTPSTVRRLMSVEHVYTSPLISGEACICTTDAYGLETCACPEGNITSTSQRTLMPEPDPLTTLGTSAVTGAVFAALPEALGDALYLSGMVSPSNAHRVKVATNAAFVLATGSWMSAGASWLTSSGLQYMGVSDPKARVGGNAAAFLVNAGRNLSPTLAAATAANYAAGRFGLWAEKKMMQKLYQRNLQPALPY